MGKITREEVVELLSSTLDALTDDEILVSIDNQHYEVAVEKRLWRTQFSQRSFVWRWLYYPSRATLFKILTDLRHERLVKRKIRYEEVEGNTVTSIEYLYISVD